MGTRAELSTPTADRGGHPIFGIRVRPGQLTLAGLTAAITVLVAAAAILAGGRPGVSTGWTVTVYYTAVESYHSGPPTPVVGCSTMDCTNGTAGLGTYPADFVAAVRAEGTGRTAAGRYLNWSYDVGFWLDQAPRDAYGQPLRPFESAAVDPTVLPLGTRFSIMDCDQEIGGTPIPAPVCTRLRQAAWVVTDQFNPGVGGPRHIDVYIGEENSPGFTEGPWYCTLADATLQLRRLDEVVGTGASVP